MHIHVYPLVCLRTRTVGMPLHSQNTLPDKLLKTNEWIEEFENYNADSGRFLKNLESSTFLKNYFSRKLPGCLFINVLSWKVLLRHSRSMITINVSFLLLFLIYSRWVGFYVSLFNRAGSWNFLITFLWVVKIIRLFFGLIYLVDDGPKIADS